MVNTHIFWLADFWQGAIGGKVVTSFKTLWHNFSSEQHMKSTCFHEKDKPFGDYCAIRLSECLIRSGINMGSFNGRRCWSHDGTKHALLAQELADYIDRAKPAGFGQKIIPAPKNFRSELSEKTGVIFFKDYWRRGEGISKESHENRTGDHIDLWNKGSLTGFGPLARAFGEFFGFVSVLRDARKVILWEVK